MRYEGESKVGNCAACHTPRDFSNGTSPTLRNPAARKVNLQAALQKKLALVNQKRSGANDIDDAYARVKLSDNDVKSLIEFLRLLEDKHDAQFRKLILGAEVMETGQGP